MQTSIRDLPAPDSHIKTRDRSLFFGALISHCLLGAAAASLLGVIELIDLHFQLAPLLPSLSDRLGLFACYSLNLVVGAALGLIIGLVAQAASFLSRSLARGNRTGLTRQLLVGLGLCSLGALVLYQQPHVFGFALGLIRETEKIAFPGFWLRFEEQHAFLVLMSLLAVCWILYSLVRASRSFPPLLRAAWLLILFILLAAAYYVDSRIEVQQYEYSLHRSMFLLSFALAMAIAASLYLAFPVARFVWVGLRFSLKLALLTAAAALLVAGLVFTFTRFDADQNIRAQVFYRTVQAKQYFKFAQWAMDFDRDGYSPYLGGGDLDDSRGDINPGETEVVGDGIDNNCIGGDLSEQAIADWRRERNSIQPGPDPSARRYNVIYIFIDTVRPDHMSVYGYSRNTTPGIEKLAARATVFENAFTPSPSTFEALPKFMQSSHWDAHLSTWTEVLAQNGYNTILFPGRRAKALPRRLKDATIVSQGKVGNAKQTVDSAIELLSKTAQDRPFCAYLYSFEPHMPYQQHKDFAFGPSLVDRYDSEIAFTDHHYGRLFDWMEKSGRLDDTIVVIMSDHGESLGERGVYKHTSQIYNEQMHVPMIVYVPGIAARRVSDYVSTIDLGTTILNACGIRAPEGYAGVGLVPLMKGEPFQHPPVYGEHVHKDESPLVSPEQNIFPDSRKYMVITQDGYKLIYNRNFYNFELFDLKSDPKEARNLYDRMPERAAEMKKLLGRFIDIVAVSRPWDADESKYFFTGDREADEQD